MIKFENLWKNSKHSKIGIFYATEKCNKNVIKDNNFTKFKKVL